MAAGTAPPPQANLGKSAGPKGAVYAPSGPKKPPGKAGFSTIGIGKGGWIYKPLSNPPAPGAQKAPKATAPKPPDWLAPRTNQSITKQATNTITKAYGPAYADINQQQNQLKGLDAKRSADMKYYQSWLKTQSDLLQSHAQAANASILGMEQNLQNEQNTQYANQTSGLVDQANARIGNVSNNAQSTPFTQGIAQNQQANEGLLLASGQQATQGVATADASLNAASANNFAVLNATRDKQITDFQTAMTKLANSRSTLQSKETGDIAKEIARLQGVEISKAQSTRSYNAAIQKLGIEAANVQSQITTRAGQLKVNQQRLSLDMTKAQLAQMNSDRNYQLNVSKFNSATAKDIYERQHGLGPYKPGKSGTPALGQASQNAIYDRIFAVRGEIDNLIANHGLSPVAAWHLLHTGGYVSTPAGANGKPGRQAIAAIGDDGLLNAAYNIRSGGDGLSPGDVNYLKNLGLSDPGSRLTVQNLNSQIVSSTAFI